MNDAHCSLHTARNDDSYSIHMTMTECDAFMRLFAFEIEHIIHKKNIICRFNLHVLLISFRSQIHQEEHIILFDGQ